MTSRLPFLALHVALAWPALSQAQQGSERPADAGDAPAARQEKMYEDVEIFRRILDRRLQPLYPRGGQAHYTGSTGGGMMGGGMGTMSGGMTGSPYRAISTQEGTLLYLSQHAQGQSLYQEVLQDGASTLEGVYLAGLGVVYTATLSSLHAPVRSESPRPVSDWERARREVRHEKEEAKKGEAGKPELSEVLLKALAENGRHFGQLGDNESLTIIITVHAPATQVANSKSTGGTVRGQLLQAAGGKEDAAKLNDLELLADLHLKQGHYQEALKVLGRAMALKPGVSEMPALYRKAAQCYLALGEDDKARAALDRLHALQKESADGGDKTGVAGKRSARLPVKLIVSAPKKLLDQVGEGKMKLEDFCRQASVKTLAFGERQPHE